MAGEVIRGRAVGVRYTVHVSGDRDGVSTRHHTLFKIGATTVVYASDAPPVIGEGDRLIIAGRMKGAVLQADAYLNETARVTGNSGLRSNLAGAIFGLLICVTALVLILLGLLPNDSDTKVFWRILAGVFGLICGGFGVYSLYRWLKIRDAVRLVKGAER
jgi:hypothetical protein